MMNQKQKLLILLRKFCDMKGSRTFTLMELNNTYQNYQNIGIGGKTPQATVRRLLQELRDDKLISFLDSRGAYTLLGIDLLEREVENKKIAQIALEIKKPEKKEYFIETYARNRGWVKEAKAVLGMNCLYPQCQNSFIKNDGTRYVEVHHILPLHLGGEDGIWNLSVVCAHHHKMAHFAKIKIRENIERILKKETECRI
ncbi:MAG: HNH endonuclease signature motif containing protein [Thermodesulfobacteriota bacterium]